jgi:hypothetical protein
MSGSVMTGIEVTGFRSAIGPVGVNFCDLA